MRKKCIYVRGLFLFLCLFLLDVNAYGLEELFIENQSKAKMDSLSVVLRNATDANTKLKALYRLSMLSWETSSEPAYLEQLAQLAENVDSMSYFYHAVSSLGRY